jgi:hypothetical protein
MEESNGGRDSTLEDGVSSLNISAPIGEDKEKKYVKDFTFGRVLGEGAYGAVRMTNDIHNMSFLRLSLVKIMTLAESLLSKCLKRNI